MGQAAAESEGAGKGADSESGAQHRRPHGHRRAATAGVEGKADAGGDGRGDRRTGQRVAERRGVCVTRFVGTRRRAGRPPARIRSRRERQDDGAESTQCQHRGIHRKARPRLGRAGDTDGRERREGHGGDHGDGGGADADERGSSHTDRPQLVSLHAQRPQGGVVARLEQRLTKEQLAQDQRCRDAEKTSQKPQGHGLQMDRPLRVHGLVAEPVHRRRSAASKTVGVVKEGRQRSCTRLQANPSGVHLGEATEVLANERRGEPRQLEPRLRLRRELARAGLDPDHAELDWNGRSRVCIGIGGPGDDMDGERATDVQVAFVGDHETHHHLVGPHRRSPR